MMNIIPSVNNHENTFQNHHILQANLVTMSKSPIKSLVGGLVAIFFSINIGLHSSSQLTKSYFSEGWPWPTNQIIIKATSHHPAQIQGQKKKKPGLDDLLSRRWPGLHPARRGGHRAGAEPSMASWGDPRAMDGDVFVRENPRLTWMTGAVVVFFQESLIFFFVIC